MHFLRACCSRGASHITVTGHCVTGHCATWRRVLDRELSRTTRERIKFDPAQAASATTVTPPATSPGSTPTPVLAGGSLGAARRDRHSVWRRQPATGIWGGRGARKPATRPMFPLHCSPPRTPAGCSACYPCSASRSDRPPSTVPSTANAAMRRNGARGGWRVPSRPFPTVPGFRHGSCPEFRPHAPRVTRRRPRSPGRSACDRH